MFVNAIQKVSGFTRAIHSISRNFGSTKIERGAATLFFVNQDGWALTCKHVPNGFHRQMLSIKKIRSIPDRFPKSDYRTKKSACKKNGV